MKEKKDAYQLYNLKLKKEENEIRNFILRRNAEKKQLLEEVDKENSKMKSYYNEMKTKATVSPQMIMASRTISEQEKEKKIQQILKIEYEIKIVKTEFLKIKNKQDELEKRSQQKRKERQAILDKKEMGRAIEESKLRKMRDSKQEEGNR